MTKNNEIKEIFKKWKFKLGISNNRPRILLTNKKIPTEEKPQIITLKQFNEMESSIIKQFEQKEELIDEFRKRLRENVDEFRKLMRENQQLKKEIE
jgi:hypothetical protein